MPRLIIHSTARKTRLNTIKISEWWWEIENDDGITIQDSSGGYRSITRCASDGMNALKVILLASSSAHDA